MKFFLLSTVLCILSVACMLQNSACSQTIIWSNDFSTPSDWSFANSTQDDQNWVISTSTSTTIGYNTGAWVDPNNNVTNENGYALFDSDAVGYDGSYQDATMMFTGTINCSSYPNVVIEFNQRIRMWQTTETILELSNDNGVTWVQFPVNLDKNKSTLYQENASINISSAAGGQQNVKFRLRYIGSWDYGWLVDDVKFIEQPANDLRSLSPYFVGTNNEGIHYGKTPLAHLDASYDIGGSVFNFGSAPNNSTGAIVNFGTGLSFPYNIGTIPSDDTLSYGGTETPNLAVGTYSGIYTVSSIEEPVGSALFANNIGKRNFAVTNNVYSIDGIGVNPTELQVTTTLGSNSFDTPTGTIFANMYHLRGGNTNNVVVSLEIGISNATTAGTQIQVAIIDAAVFLANGAIPVVDANGNDAISNYYTVTAADITAGKITAYFSQPVVLTDNAYFACVYTEVSADNIIRILNDETVAQPSYASMIHLINDQTYANGNAFAIRMNIGPSLLFPTSAVLSGSTTICPGAITNLSVAVTGGGATYTVTVTDGTNNYSATSASPVSITVSPSVTSTYTIVSVTGGGGTCTENSGTATVTLTPIPEEPTGLSCWQTANLNTSTCTWDVSGTQVQAPTGLSCWQTAAFNTATCTWDVSGEQAAQPTLACYETAVFNTATCAWVVSGPKTPQKMSYQAVIRNSTDSLLISTPVGMRISLVQGTPSGTVVFSETQTATTNANGLVSLQIGMGTVVTGTFACIDWAAGPYYVKTETDLAGGTNYTIISTNEIQSVPYALFSENGIAPGTVAGEMNYWNGTAWVTVAPGTNNQNLTFCNGVPTWGPCPE